MELNTLLKASDDAEKDHISAAIAYGVAKEACPENITSYHVLKQNLDKAYMAYMEAYRKSNSAYKAYAEFRDCNPIDNV